MTVGEYMSRDPVVVATNEPIDRISQTMVRLGIHQVPVVDESGRLVGIVTDRDIRAAIGYGERNREMSLVAEDIMTTNVISVAVDADISQAVQLLRQRRYGGLPVLSHGKVTGIITRHDLLKLLSEFLAIADEAEQPLRETPVRTPDTSVTTRPARPAVRNRKKASQTTLTR